MLRHFTSLLAFAPAVLLGQVAPSKEDRIPAISLLPDGSQLKGVMLPRYDENQNLTAVLRAAVMTLVNSEQIAGTDVTLEFFNPDESPRGRADFKTAIFHKLKGLVEAREPVEIQSDQLTALGSGLIYSLTTGEGYLLGPATTMISQPKETAMQSPRKKIQASAIASIALVAQPLAAAPPPNLTAQDKAALLADATTKAPEIAAANEQTQQILAESSALSAAANSAATKFRAETQVSAPLSNTPDSAPTAPLAVQATPTQTLITCDGGMYFDAEKGILVYSKNVVVKDPRFELTGANELKVFLAKKPTAPEKPQNPEAHDHPPTSPDAQPPPSEKRPPMGEIGASFGAVERILANGAVRILQKETTDGKDPIEASGAIFNYNVASGEIIISGGFPWVKQGPNFLRATEPDLNLRIQKSGSFATEGKWQMGGELNPNP